MVNSKQKGNAFERKIAKTLSERFAAHAGLENSFRRNADSGSFFGGSNKSRTETYDTSKATMGDIITPKGFRFSIECKAYKDPPSLAAIISGKCRQLDVWIAQAEADAEASGTIPMLVIKYNNCPVWAMVAGTVWEAPAIPYGGFVIVDFEDVLKRGDEFFFGL